MRSLAFAPGELVGGETTVFVAQAEESMKIDLVEMPITSGSASIEWLEVAGGRGVHVGAFSAGSTPKLTERLVISFGDRVLMHVKALTQCEPKTIQPIIKGTPDLDVYDIALGALGYRSRDE